MFDEIQSSGVRELYASFIISYGFLLEGIDDTFTAFFIPSRENLTIKQEALAGSTQIFFGPIGAFVSMIFIDRLGRKFTTQLALLSFLTGWLLIASCSSATSPFLYVGRAFCGFGEGAHLSPSISYISEVCHEKRRGSMLSVRLVCLIVGNNISLIMGYYFQWKSIAWVAILLTATGLLQTLTIPETKHWYLLKRQPENAKRSLLWFSPGATLEKTDAELKSIERSFLTKTSNTFSFSSLRRELRPFLVATMLRLFLAGTGRWAVATHVEHFFAAFKSTYNERLLSVLSGIADLLSCCIYSRVADKFGRKTMMYMVVTLLISNLTCILIYDSINAYASLSVFPVIMIYIYLSGLIALNGNLTIATTELIVGKNRGVLLSVMNILYTMAAATVSYTLPYAIQYWGIKVVLSYFLGNLVMILWVTRYFVSETSGKEGHEADGRSTDGVEERLLDDD